MNIGHIAGGTNAGWRRVKLQASDWRCPACNKNLKHYWLTCPNDKTPRPDSKE